MPGKHSANQALIQSWVSTQLREDLGELAKRDGRTVAGYVRKALEDHASAILGTRRNAANRRKKG